MRRARSLFSIVTTTFALVKRILDNHDRMVSDTKPKHLFVLVHGLWGNYKHMNSVKVALEEAFGESGQAEEDRENAYYVAHSSEYFRTLHGIEVVGYRTIAELCDFVNAYGVNKFDRISFIGYSMGGLVSRFVIGVIFREFQEVFGGMRPVLFMTFATPHLGIQFYTAQCPEPVASIKTSALKALRFIGSHFLGRSGRQMFLAYGNDETLVRMTEGDFIENLKRFKFRVCFANVRNDRTVAFYTSYISDCDPFIETGNRLLYVYDNNLPTEDELGVNPLILDMDLLNPSLEHSKRNRRCYLACLHVVFLTVFMVVFLPFFFIINCMATIYSYAVTMTHQHRISKGHGTYMVKRQLNITDTINDTMRSAVGNVVNQDFDSHSPSLTPSTSTIKSSSDSWDSFIQHHSKKFTNDKFRKLPFDEKRATMFRNLNELIWLRVPIYVKTMNAHDGIIARSGLDDSHPSSVASVKFAAHLVHYLVTIQH